MDAFRRYAVRASHHTEIRRRCRADPAGKLAALATALFEAKNVYPAQTLAGCAAPDKFILGRSALGSEPPAPT